MTERKRYSKNWDVLVSENIEDILHPTEGKAVDREPLLKFSFYLSTRNNQLASVADDILDLLDSGITDNSVDYKVIGNAGTLMWLWTLGAYEMVRTMCQAKSCFSKVSMEKLMATKKVLAQVRMPDAKMEKPGKSEAVISTRSPFAEDVVKKDLLIGDPYTPSSARETLDIYFSAINSLTSSDVLASHEESYK